MTFEVHFFQAESFFKKHGKFITESWDRYSLEFHMLDTSQEQIKILQEAKQFFSQEKNIDREAKSALMKWFNRNINHAQEYVNANGSASASQSSQSNETLNTGESKGQYTGKTEPEKINWKGSQTQLAYLVQILLENGFIEHGDHWKMCAEHFLWQGKPIDNKKLAAAIGNVASFNKDGKPKKAEILESIVSDISNLED